MSQQIVRKGKARFKDGFTLVELMIVVVIMGVLAAVAVIAYNTYVRRARTAEASGLLANLKASQESYRSEFGLYCNVASNAPAADPGADGMVWDDGAIHPNWQMLGFRPDTKVVSFQLNTISGTPGNADIAGWNGGDNAITLPTDIGEFTQDHWFIARALGDQDDDDTDSVFWITQMTTGVSFRRETE